MGSQKTLTFTRERDWSNAAATDLKRIAAASEQDIADWQELVASGVFCMERIDLDAEPIGHLIWSIEDEPSRRVIAINAMGCKPVRGVSLADQAHRFAKAQAKIHGCNVVRFWTEREGLRRKLQGHFKTMYVMEQQL